VCAGFTNVADSRITNASKTNFRKLHDTAGLPGGESDHLGSHWKEETDDDDDDDDLDDLDDVRDKFLLAGPYAVPQMPKIPQKSFPDLSSADSRDHYLPQTVSSSLVPPFPSAATDWWRSPLLPQHRLQPLKPLARVGSLTSQD
jgi:hypothetical protein